MILEKAFKNLEEGNARYVSGVPQQTSVSTELRNNLFTKGQSPYAAIVGCSDSRVPIELIFDAGPGELFVIRTAGNVIGAFEMGSLEYAVGWLKTPLVIVVGHQHCGAVHLALEGGESGEALEEILQEIRSGIQNANLTDIDAAENDNIRHSLSKIAANPLIAKYVSQGAVRLVAAKYSLETGKVSFF